MKAKLQLLLLLTFLGVFSLAHGQALEPLSWRDSVDYLVNLAEKIYREKNADAAAMVERAHRYAQAEGYTSGEGKVLYLQGIMDSFGNKAEQAAAKYLRSAELFESINDSTRAGRAYTRLAALSLHRLHQYTNAFRYCTRAIHLLRHDSQHLPAAESTLASLHLQSGKLDEALALYKKNYTCAQKNNDLRSMSIALNNIATVYDYKKEFNFSIEYYNKSLEMSRTLQDHTSVSNTLLGLGQAYCQLKDHQRSEAAMNEALIIAREHGLHDLYIYSLQNIAAEMEHVKRHPEALKHALEAKRYAEEHHLFYHKGNIYRQLATIYKCLGKHDLAIIYQNKHTQFADSLAQQERMAVEGLALDKKDERSQANAAIEDKSPFPKWVIVVSMMVVIPTLVFITFNQNKKKVALTGDTQEAPENEHESEATSHPVAKTETTDGVATLQHLEVVNGEGIKLLSLDAIWWFQKDGKSYRAYTATGNYRVRQNLPDLEPALPKDKFFRINRAVIINTAQMSNYSFWENHKYIIRMKDEGKTEFVISRNRLREMKEVFQVLEKS